MLQLCQFFKKVRNGEAASFFNNLGKETQRELLAKTQVIIDYNDSISNINSAISEQDDLVLLTKIKETQNELRELIDRRNIIDERIAELQILVNEKNQINAQIESICLSIEQRLFNMDNTNYNKKQIIIFVKYLLKLIIKLCQLSEYIPLPLFFTF